MRSFFLICGVILFLVPAAFTQDAEALLKKVRARIEQVHDYEATGVMKTNVPFLKVPVADVMVYFKSPDKLKIKNEKGISLVPKGASSMSLNSLMANNQFTAIAGKPEKLNGITVQVIKLLPMDESAEVVLSTLYIDEAREVILKARTTTRENGTYEVELQYGKFLAYALPDKAVFTFNLKEYKLPKGITFDYDDGTEKKTRSSTMDSNKGQLEITYNTYKINKGVADSVFK